MGGSQGVRKLDSQVYELFRSKRSSGKTTFQGFAFHQFHDEIIGPDVVEGTDIGMIQCSDGPGLPFKTRTEPFVGNLNCHIAAQTGVVRLIDRAHPTTAEASLNEILSINELRTIKRKFQDGAIARTRGMGLLVTLS